MSSDHESLGTALPAEMARVRDEVIPAYESIGPSGIFAITWMKLALDNAAKAMIEGDLPAMIEAYKELKGASAHDLRPWERFVSHHSPGRGTL